MVSSFQVDGKGWVAEWQNLDMLFSCPRLAGLSIHVAFSSLGFWGAPLTPGKILGKAPPQLASPKPLQFSKEKSNS